MIKSVIFAIFVLTTTQAFADANVCSYENLCARYGKGYQNAAGERLRSKFPKGFDRSKFNSPQVKARLDIIFNQTQSLLLGVIENEAMLSAEVRKELAARVKSVALALQPDRESSEGYNAAFWSDSHEMLAEYSIGEMPKANLINLFAHEFSHSFDEAAAGYTLVQDGKQVYENDETQNPSAGKRTILSNPFDWNEMAPIMGILSGYGIKSNQMSESVSDYFARKVSEVYLASVPAAEQKNAALEGQMDIIVQGCNHPEYIDKDTSAYPPLRTRVEWVYFGSPIISKLAGCQP
jgi:hypothetical protein